MGKSTFMNLFLSVAPSGAFFSFYQLPNHIQGLRDIIGSEGHIYTDTFSVLILLCSQQKTRCVLNVMVKHFIIHKTKSLYNYNLNLPKTSKGS